MPTRKLAKSFVLLFFAIMLFLPVQAQERKSDRIPNQLRTELYRIFFKMIETFEVIEVTLLGDAEKIGLVVSELNDYVKLRFKNSFPGIKTYTLSPAEKLNAMTLQDEVERNKVQMKLGVLTCRVWAVGDDSP